MFIYEDTRTSVNLGDEMNYGIGIDLGIESYASVCDEMYDSIKIPSFLDDVKYKKLCEEIKYFQRLISKKAEVNYKRLYDDFIKSHHREPNEKEINIMKGESYRSNNIKKLQHKVRVLYTKRSNYALDFILKLVNKLTITKPEYITIEKLDIKAMLEHDDSSHTLKDHIAKSKWHEFGIRLANKCHDRGIELRQADKWFASSKKCSRCGTKNENLTLNDRLYYCAECGLKIDRDINAAINLCFKKKYSII